MSQVRVLHRPLKHAVVAQVAERFSEKEEVAGAHPAHGTKCGCRIVVIILPCQGRDGGSTPLTRSKTSILTDVYGRRVAIDKGL